MVIEKLDSHYRVEVDAAFRAILKDLDIFQKRSGFSGGVSPAGKGPYEDRFCDGDIVLVARDARIEPFTTFDAGNVLHSCGAFTSMASNLGLNTVVGRYSCIGVNVRRMGFRHPVESVSLNSAVFNFNRENVAAYLDGARQRDGDLPPLKPVPLPQPQDGTITIGNDVWIGDNVILKGGITIGDGAVIAANSLVTRNVPSYRIVAGTPAVVKKPRFADDICRGLQQTRWWTYDLADMFRAGLPFHDPKSFVAKFLRARPKLRPLVVDGTKLVKLLA